MTIHMRRYSAVALFSHDLERVVLIHKLRPAWQADKANFPGGKVEYEDKEDAGFADDDATWLGTDWAATHINAAVREMHEETGLTVDAASLTLFCTLRFRIKALPTAQGEAGECRFYCGVGDVDAAQTRESEPVFVADVDDVLDGQVIDGAAVTLPTMGNLPWLVAMARQRLRGDVEWRPGYVVEEVVS